MKKVLVVLFLVLVVYFYRDTVVWRSPSGLRYSPTTTWTEENQARMDRGNVLSELRRIREELETMRSEQEWHRLRDRLRSY